MSSIRTATLVMMAVSAFAGLFAGTPEYPQGEFTANISASIPDWRPHKAYNADEAQILSSVYEGLFVYDPYNLDPVPALAESWTVSKDSLVWTFRIRASAKFENGDPITSKVIRDSWIAMLSPAISAPYASLLDPIVGVAAFRTGYNTDPSSVGIQADRDDTLVVRLVTPAAQLPKILCHHAFAAIHPSQLADSLKDKPSVDYRPIASGAFKVDKVSQGEIRLVKNPAYWDAANVALPSVRLILSDNAAELTSRYNRGEINWLAGSSVVNKIIGSDSIHITPMFSTEYFFFRTTWGPGANSKVRNALLLAVPWTQLRASYIIPAKTLVFPIANYPEIDGIDTLDVDGAKKLLADAGIADPSTLPPLVISVPESEAFLNLAKILQSAWTGLGFKVEIHSTPYSRYYGSLRTNDYTVGITIWIGDFADPLSFLEMFRPASSLNDSGWSNDSYEKCINDAASIKQIKDRYAKLADAEKILLDDGVILPVAHNPALNIIDTDGIAGWYANALDIHPFKFVKFTQKKALPGVALLER
jgi:ABC-type oligopeptide transport system substrate-binding subunit